MPMTVSIYQNADVNQDCVSIAIYKQTSSYAMLCSNQQNLNWGLSNLQAKQNINHKQTKYKKCMLVLFRHIITSAKIGYFWSSSVQLSPCWKSRVYYAAKTLKKAVTVY